MINFHRKSLLRHATISHSAINRMVFSSSQAISEPKKLFKKVLIANRGEIAIRVMRTCKRLGIQTVAVYSEADARSLHVQTADEAVCIGPTASSESYLNIPRIIAAALSTGADAIHPGYGFLSENASFVDAVEASGLVFIGPSAESMRKMGDKINSKHIAVTAGCSVIPGYIGEISTNEFAIQKANEIGYPIMIKASAGGGGKGMRIAYSNSELIEYLTLCKSESMSSFGDDRILLEKFVSSAHHIEIQIIADKHGNIVAFPERECSLQRRNQKMLEESPSCMLQDGYEDVRLKMQQQAMQLCRATDYWSAGTVEMLLDVDRNFYFLEMNTRLQVEHPVTESVTGEDLVELMLLMAANQTLPSHLLTLPNSVIPPKGWAIESRIYAEDPIRNFMPSAGTLLSYHEPTLRNQTQTNDYINGSICNGFIRVDSGVFEGSEISMFYDPLISKLITYAATRSIAIQYMRHALEDYVIRGVQNNLNFLRDVCSNATFLGGIYDTNFIPIHFPKGFSNVELSYDDTVKVAVFAAMLNTGVHTVHEGKATFGLSDLPILKCNSLVVSMVGKSSYVLQVKFDENDHTRMVISSAENKEASSSVVLEHMQWMYGRHSAEVCIVTDRLRSEENEKVVSREHMQYFGRTNEGIIVGYKGSVQTLVVRSIAEDELSKYMIAPVKTNEAKYLVSPMPGTLVRLVVEAGEVVEIGQPLAVVEAMKMQNVLRAVNKVKISKVCVKEGARLSVDQVIMEFEGSD